MATQTSRTLLVIVAVVALGAGLALFLSRGNERTAESTPGPAARGAEDRAPGSAPGTAAHAPAGKAAEPPAPPAAGTDGPRRLEGKEARDRLLRAISEARTRREAGARPTPQGQGASAGDEAPPFDKAYIQSVVRGAVPLIRECYELALDTTPALAGTLTVEFSIAGEPEVGGLVEAVDIAQDTEIGRHAAMAECIRETVLSLEFDPPPGGGKVMVRYPFEFSSSADGE